MDLNAWGPAITILAGVIGWFLNEISHALRLGRQKKDAVGRAIADLLEIRHHSLALSSGLKEVLTHFGLSPDLSTDLRPLFTPILPRDADLPRRYAAAVTEIARFDPLLAFRLRSKEQVPEMILQMMSLSKGAPEGFSMIRELDIVMTSSFMKLLDDSIRELGWQHGFKTCWRVRRMLSKSVELPAEFHDLLTRLVARARTQGVGTNPPI